MKEETQTPTPEAERNRWHLYKRLFIGLALIAFAFVGTIAVLFLLGVLRTFSVPSEGMEPTISKGDHILMERITFLFRTPRRGDIVVFTTEGIPSFGRSAIYVKRVAGEPGDRLRISDGRLYINDKHIALSNAAGEITYSLPPWSQRTVPRNDVSVPAGHFFVLGDNSIQGTDSRLWGSVPARNIIGRVLSRVSPLGRVEQVE